MDFGGGGYVEEFGGRVGCASAAHFILGHHGGDFVAVAVYDVNCGVVQVFPEGVDCGAGGAASTDY